MIYKYHAYIICCTKQINEAWLYDKLKHYTRVGLQGWIQEGKGQVNQYRFHMKTTPFYHHSACIYGYHHKNTLQAQKYIMIRQF